MTEDFYASYLEKKFRKKLDIVNIVILIVISLIFTLLSVFFTPLWCMISIPIFFIYALFIFKRLKYHLYIKPINRILTQNMDASLFKSISEHSPEYNPISMWAISAALGEGDYQRAVNICNYQLRNTKDEKTKELALRFLLQIYFELQDVEKLRAVKTKYDELFQNNTNKPINFVNFIEKFIDEDFENSRKYLGASISAGVKPGDGKHLMKAGINSIKSIKNNGVKHAFKYYASQTYNVFYKKMFKNAFRDLAESSLNDVSNHYVKTGIEYVYERYCQP